MVGRRRSSAAKEAAETGSPGAAAKKGDSHMNGVAAPQLDSRMPDAKAAHGDAQADDPLPTVKRDRRRSRRKGRTGSHNKGETLGEGAGAAASNTSLAPSLNLMIGSIIQRQPSNVPVVFTHDGEFFFVASSSAVKIFATTTGRLVSTLSSTLSGDASAQDAGHSAAITSMVLNPSNVLQLITASLDGTVKVWDFLDGILIRTINAGYPITHMALHETCPGRVCVALLKPRHLGEEKDNTSTRLAGNSASTRGQYNSIVQTMSLNTSTARNARSTTPMEVARVGKARHTSGLAYSPDGRFIVLVGKRKIHVASTQGSFKGFSKILTDANITTLAFHPQENTFATGDDKGQIRLWYFLSDKSVRLSSDSQQQTAPSTLLHWHAHAVSALTFTRNGAYLVSGGEESVLVLWQLSNMSREYVPRLGGASIASVSVLDARLGGRQEQYVAALRDGSIVFVSTTNLKPLRTIAGALSMSSPSDNLPHGKRALKGTMSPIAVQPTTEHLVMAAGHPTSLQFVDLVRDEQIMQLEVISSNRVSRPDEAPLAQSYIEHVAFSTDAAWMATLDKRPTNDTSLKIWQWDSRKKQYDLNTRIDDPHGQSHDVTSVGFSPRAFGSLSSAPILLTVGRDKKCKLWRCFTQQGKRAGIQETFWMARSAVEYRNLKPTSFAWSHDASLLAIAFGGCVVLWEPLTNALLHVVTVPSGRDVALLSDDPIDAVQSVAFVGRGGRYMAAVSHTILTVWDCVLGVPIGEVEQATARLVLPWHNSEFAVINDVQDGSSQLSTYDSGSTTVVSRDRLPFQVKHVVPARTGSAIGNKAMSFIALTMEGDVVSIAVPSPLTESLAGESKAHSLRGVSIKRRTLYDELFGSKDIMSNGESAFLPSKKEQKMLPSNRTASAATLFDMPAHLLPPVQTLFEPFMQRIISLQADTRAEKSEVDDSSNAGDHGGREFDEEQKKAAAANTSTQSKPLRGQKHLEALPFDMKAIDALFSQLATSRGGDVPTNGAPPSALITPPFPATKTPEKQKKKGSARPSAAADASIGTQSEAGEEIATRRTRARKS